jgi:hypothetical protein
MRLRENVVEPEPGRSRLGYDLARRSYALLLRTAARAWKGHVVAELCSSADRVTAEQADTIEPGYRSLGPELVFIPTQRVRGGDGQAQLQLREMVDGRKAVLIYTSLELLVTGCGRQQDWIAAPVEALERLQSIAGFDVIAVNVELPGDWCVPAEGAVR